MNSRVFISGATGGLGRSLAAECASRGWDLFLTDLHEDRLQNLAGALSSAYNVSVDWHACDMADAGSRTCLLDALRERNVRLHMAVNVAGLDHEGMFLEKPREQILTILNVNAVGTVDMMHSLTGLRDRTRRFHLINVCSLAGMFPMPVKATYAATKRLLIDMSLALREEFRAINATVTALCPAGMATNEELLKSLDVQGFAGRITTLEVGYIASKTIDYALKGKAVFVPGFVNRVLLSASRLFPASFVAKMIGKRWSRTNRALKKTALTPNPSPIA
jgi:short-subunit dehydrogenase